MQLHFGLNIQKLSGLGLSFANDLLSPREPKTQHNIYQTTDENFTYIFLCHLLMLAMCKLNFQNVTLTCWFLRRLPFSAVQVGSCKDSHLVFQDDPESNLLPALLSSSPRQQGCGPIFCDWSCFKNFISLCITQDFILQKVIQEILKC